MGEDEQKAWIEDEAREWEKDGIIDEEQLKVILARYDLQDTPAHRTVNKKDKTSDFTTVLSILGALLIGVGAILFVASNWGEIPVPVKLLLLFGTTYITYFAGWNLKYKKRSNSKLGDALLFLASILVGASIFLSAQIFNVNAEAHWLILAWFLAIMPFGYAFNSRSILTLNIFTFTLWLVIYMRQGIDFPDMFETFMLYLLFGIILYGIGQLHRVSEQFTHFRELYQGYGLSFILISYFYLSERLPWFVFYSGPTSFTWKAQVLSIIFMVIAIMLISKSVLLYKKDKNNKYELFVLILAFTGWLGIWILIFFDSKYSYYYDTEYTMSQTKSILVTITYIIYYLIFFILSIGSILIGYYRSTLSFINIGMISFMVGVISLYFNTGYRLLPRSLAFIVGGIILLLLGWYMEKKRRSMINEIKGEHKV